MTPLSQYDQQWKDIILGTSNVTIGGYGCLITCCSMLAGTTPDKLNQRLMEVEGYLDHNLLIWAKLGEATNGVLTFNWLNYEYNNEGVKTIIEQEGGCIVRVNNNGTMHFVLYIGNGQMIDPLGGQIVSTSRYPALGFADITVKKSLPISTTTMSEQDKKDIESMNKLRAYNGVWYESQNIIDDFEKLKKDRATDNENSLKSYLALEVLYKEALEQIKKLQEENGTTLADKPTNCQPLDERFRGIKLADKLKACIDILTA